MRTRPWASIVMSFGLLALMSLGVGTDALAKQASAADDTSRNRGDPKTTYDQSENAAHGHNNGGGAQSPATAENQTSASDSATDTHWLVRQIKDSTDGRWTLYENGEVKRAGSP